MVKGRCLPLLVVVAGLAAACGNTWIGQTSAAREQPRLEALNLADIAVDALTLPNVGRSVKFAVIGDSGRGSKEQQEVAAKIEAYRRRFNFNFVLMVGDNIYEGPASEEDY